MAKGGEGQRQAQASERAAHGLSFTGNHSCTRHDAPILRKTRLDAFSSRKLPLLSDAQQQPHSVRGDMSKAANARAQVVVRDLSMTIDGIY